MKNGCPFFQRWRSKPQWKPWRILPRIHRPDLRQSFAGNTLTTWREQPTTTRCLSLQMSNEAWSSPGTARDPWHGCSLHRAPSSFFYASSWSKTCLKKENRFVFYKTWSFQSFCFCAACCLKLHLLWHHSRSSSHNTSHIAVVEWDMNDVSYTTEMSWQNTSTVLEMYFKSAIAAIPLATIRDSVVSLEPQWSTPSLTAQPLFFSFSLVNCKNY